MVSRALACALVLPALAASCSLVRALCSFSWALPRCFSSLARSFPNRPALVCTHLPGARQGCGKVAATGARGGDGLLVGRHDVPPGGRGCAHTDPHTPLANGFDVLQATCARIARRFVWRNRMPRRLFIGLFYCRCRFRRASQGRTGYAVGARLGMRLQQEMPGPELSELLGLRQAYRGEAQKSPNASNNFCCNTRTPRRKHRGPHPPKPASWPTKKPASASAN